MSSSDLGICGLKPNVLCKLRQSQTMMERLGRFPLSLVLSFLDEADGVSLLTTKKVYYDQVLPMFRLPLELNQARYQYRFRVAPVHDPSTLLARMNTIRLFRRKITPKSRSTTHQMAHSEWRDQQETGKASFPPQLELFRLSDPTLLDMTILLASYPRSGNTLVRSLWEAVTGVISGSDTRPDRPLSQQLDFTGEGYVNAKFCKTHWPERRGYAPIVAHAAVVLVRNPYDAMDSYWNMNATCTHTETVTDAVYRKFQKFWERLIQNEIQVWIDYLAYWEDQQRQGMPILFVRYEDVARHPDSQMENILRFTLGQENLSEFWQYRIQHVVSGRAASTFGVYRPRAAGTSFGKSLKRYSTELLNFVQDTADADPHGFLHRFGYSIREQNFPANFIVSQPIKQRVQRSPNNCKRLTINVGASIRPVDCPFGRGMQAWRHSVTNYDEEPLPTVPKS